jgi:hypothetical protein
VEPLTKIKFGDWFRTDVPPIKLPLKFFIENEFKDIWSIMESMQVTEDHYLTLTEAERKKVPIIVVDLMNLLDTSVMLDLYSASHDLSIGLW